MPIFHDYYDLDILVDDTSIFSDPARISFSMSDSIYNLYNTLTATIDDPGGFFLERLVYARGNRFSLRYGIKSQTVNHAKYVITNSYMREPSQENGTIAGPVTIEAKNRWYHTQEIQSRGFSQPISNILTNMITPLDVIDGVDIEDTEGSDTFYQPLVNDAEFIDKILTPNAYSPSANGTPFYSFITNDNIFRFRSAHAMYSANLSDELTYSTEASTQGSRPQSILSIRYVRDDRDAERKLRNRYIYRMDTDNGQLIQTEDEITDYLGIGNRFLPFVADMSLKTGYIDLGREEVTIDARNTELAELHNSNRPSMFLEHFLILTPFNPRLKSGQKIQINIGSADKEDKSEESKTFTGPYVIENCEHIWNGEALYGYTKIIVGRKYIRTGATYPMRDRLAR